MSDQEYEGSEGSEVDREFDEDDPDDHHEEHESGGDFDTATEEFDSARDKD